MSSDIPAYLLPLREQARRVGLSFGKGFRRRLRIELRQDALERPERWGKGIAALADVLAEMAGERLAHRERCKANDGSPLVYHLGATRSRGTTRRGASRRPEAGAAADLLAWLQGWPHGAERGHTI